MAMEPPLDSPESETDSNKSFENYENPNFRKLYATLSVTTMMGCNPSDATVDMDSSGVGDGVENNDKQLLETASLLVTDDDGQEKQDLNDLPTGWEKHEDDNGPYYWHIPSGTIQREQPTIDSTKRDSIIYYEEEDEEGADNEVASEVSSSGQPMAGPNTFTVHSLGWMEFDESLLTAAMSSKAIQRCILELTTRGENAVRCWGKQETKQLILKIENSHLKLYDMATNKLLNLQPIASIRVWGVNDNNDLAYVSRDPPPPMVTSADGDIDGGPASAATSPTTPSGLKCHVFHVEDEDNQEAAQYIATMLRDEMIRVKSQHDVHIPRGLIQGPNRQTQRPQHLIIGDCRPSPLSTPNIEFPTPIEEPRKTIVAKYLGRLTVNKPVGINVLNEAMERAISQIKCRETNSPVDEEPTLESPLLLDDQCIHNVVSLVHISPSNITIESTANGQTLLECRVRYLSFLGISKENVKNCGFIIQIGDNKFEAHCFECEPSSGALCKTIEAACKLRYQKCLDAHKQRCNALLASEGHTKQGGSPAPQGSNLKATLKNVFSKILK